MLKDPYLFHLTLSWDRQSTKVHLKNKWLKLNSEYETKYMILTKSESKRMFLNMKVSQLSSQVVSYPLYLTF